MTEDARANRYDRFASALRTEMDGAGLGDIPPDLSRLDETTEPARLKRRFPIVWAAAAVIVLVVGGLSYPTVTTLQTRRLISEENQQFLDDMFQRSLFDTGSASDNPPGESSWFAAGQITAGLNI